MNRMIFNEDPVQWVREVNRRWIVHRRLNETTDAFLDHLEKTDPARLKRACILANELLHRSGETDDPKALFYSGLFSVATPAEAKQFLSHHLFTKLACSDAENDQATRASLSASTRQKIEWIRKQIAKLLVDGED